ncbi:MAG: hypothetical protein AAF809_00765 [Bacteroidota bacterium]
MDRPPEPPRSPAPSRYVWEEAQLVAGTAQVPSSAMPQPLVLVAESEAYLRTQITASLAEDQAEEAPAFRVEAVSTPERLLSRLRRGGVSIVLCGALPPLADGRSLDEALTDKVVGRTVVLMTHQVDGALSASLQHTVQARRLGDAMVRLLQRSPLRAAS